MHFSLLIVAFLSIFSSPSLSVPLPQAMGQPDVLLSTIQLENRHSHTLEKRFLFSLLGGILSAVPIVGPLLGTPLIMIDEAIAKAINKKKEAPQEAAAAMDEAVDEIASLEALVAAGEVATSLAPEVNSATPSPYAPLRTALASTYATRASSNDVATPSVQAVYANSVGAPTHVKAAYASSSSAPCSQDSSVPLTTYYRPPAASYHTNSPTTSPILPSSHVPTIPSVKATSIC